MRFGAKVIYTQTKWIEQLYGLDRLYQVLLVTGIIVAVVSYLLGCFNGAVIVSKYILRDDVRKHGSGNAGLTNFYRTFGGPLTAVVILCDVLKMVLAVQVGVWAFRLLKITDPLAVVYIKCWAGMFCVLGHMYPCMFKFKGGKGVLSGGTLLWLIDWRIALVSWVGFLVLAALTRWVSLGSCWAGFVYPFSTWFVYHDVILVLVAIGPGWLRVWKHRGNLKRVLNGTESNFSFHRKKNAG